MKSILTILILSLGVLTGCVVSPAYIGPDAAYYDNPAYDEYYYPGYYSGPYVAGYYYPSRYSSNEHYYHYRNGAGSHGNWHRGHGGGRHH